MWRWVVMPVLVQVHLGEEEPEDIAVRKFMKAVMESKVVEQVRGRSAVREHNQSVYYVARRGAMIDLMLIAAAVEEDA
jgi:hypothetical protein